MNTIHIHASSSYNVYIGAGILCDLGAVSATLVTPGKAVIISDSNVWQLYGPVAKEALLKSGFQVSSYVLTAGEASKNAQSYLSILNFLVAHNITRSDLIIALGGGVTGDLAGFAAATYLRGVKYIQVPTTLLSMVDSSVGGKTAIDLPAGKNLVGAIWQPAAVICDTALLRSLPDDIYFDGCAEIIKYALLYDESLFSHLEVTGPSFALDTVITKCVEFKRDAVEQDEFDNGCRRMLNLGHTVGHAAECLNDFSISHGRAISIGMSVITRAAVYHGLCDEQTLLRLQALLEKFHLPTKSSLSAAQLYEHMLSDKKRLDDHIYLVIPRKIGHCILERLPIDKLQSFIEAGL